MQYTHTNGAVYEITPNHEMEPGRWTWSYRRVGSSTEGGTVLDMRLLPGVRDWIIAHKAELLAERESRNADYRREAAAAEAAYQASGLAAYRRYAAEFDRYMEEQG